MPPDKEPGFFYATASSFFVLLLIFMAGICAYDIVKRRRLMRQSRADAEFLLDQADDERARSYAPHENF